MTALKRIGLATLMVSPFLMTGPVQAATAYQNWAQGRGAYVSSKDRLWTWRDDLNSIGIAPPPPPPGYAYPPPPPPPGYYNEGGSYD